MSRSRPRGRLIVVIVVLCLMVAALVLGLVILPFSFKHAVSEAQLPTSGESAGERSVSGQVASTTGAQTQTEQTSGEPFKACEVCHPDFLQKPDSAGDLIFSHSTHIAKDVKCRTCHGSPLGHYSAPKPTMTTCLSCHNDETAPNQCSNCHRKLDQIAPGLGETVVHLNPDARTRTTCAKCHDVKVWCEKCHGVEMPHPATWKATHGQVALKQSDVCVKCHQSKDATFCVRCHGVEMPHPAYWYSNHGDIARANKPACVKCHPGGDQFCSDCHHAGFSPTPQWATSQHGQVATQQGTAACFACHAPSFCATCHPGKTF
ncbi:MAG: hypothetical protein M1337_05545 [Actinobacteria bacterium]|nr:hypothetical protein [Actinomycetota bacterium]